MKRISMVVFCIVSLMTAPSLTHVCCKSWGEFSYGPPFIVKHWGEDAYYSVGKFCSFADEITIFLGGNHRVDWISTYPFPFYDKEFPEAVVIKGHPATNGDVIIGNDVWIGSHATIL